MVYLMDVLDLSNSPLPIGIKVSTFYNLAPKKRLMIRFHSIGYANTWSSIVNPNGGVVKADPECGMNKLEYPEGSTPLHKIFEEYAADQNKFVQDFIRAFEKMLSNGYETLSLGPDQFTDVICNRAEKWGGWKYTNCYLEDEINSNVGFIKIYFCLQIRPISS